MNTSFRSFDNRFLLGESATGRSSEFGRHAVRLRSSTGLQASTRRARAIAHFPGLLALLLLLAEFSLPRRRVYPEGRGNVPSHLSN